jgi:uncharacterized protein (DUF3084 family)
MKTFEALAILIAARDGSRWTIFKKEDIRSCMEAAKRQLREIGLTRSEIESPFSHRSLQEGLDLIDNNPAEFTRQCLEAEEWHNRRN